MAYDPYTYNPQLRAFYVDSNFTNQRTLPGPEIVQAASEQPQAAKHIYSVWSFLEWMRASTPELYAIVSADRSLSDPVAVATGTALIPHARSARTTRQGLSGLGTIEEDAIDRNVVYDSTSGVQAGAFMPSTDLVTDWGNRISDLAGKYLQYDQQKRIVDLNIKRAEKGLNPISGSFLAPTVNVGASPEVTRIGYLAVAGLIVAGLVAAFNKAKK